MRIPRTQLACSGLLCGWLTILAGCGFQQTQSIVQFQVTATPATVNVGGAVTLHAMLKLSGGTSQDVTSSTQWTLSNPKMGSLSNGTLSTKAPGTLSIQGAYVAPASSSNTAAQTVSSAAQVVINSSTPTTNPTAPAIVWNQPAAIQYGTPLSSAQLSATASVSGTFTFTPAAGVVLPAGSQTLNVTFTPTDTSTYTTATASVPLTVTQATPVITWPRPAGVQAGTALGATQLNAIASVPGIFVYTPPSGTVLQAGTQQLSATFTPWDGTDYTPAAAHTSISVAAKPTVTLTAIQISASATSVSVGGTLQFRATGTYSDNSTKDLTGTAAWHSSSSSATVGGGTVTGVSAGTAAIAADSAGVTSAPVTVTVSPATATLTSIQISASATSVTVGSTLQFTATGTYSDKSTKDLTGTATWQSSNGSFATVSGGTVTGVAAGTALITVSSGGVISAPVTVTVNPAAVTLTSIQISAPASSVTVGSSLRFRAIGTYSDKSTRNLTGTTTWQSSNGSFATVSRGTVTGLGAGTTLITASSNGVTSAPVTVTVNAAAVTLIAIQISGSANSVIVGHTLQFTATGTYSDKTTKDITGAATWQSSNGSFATVSGGTVTGIAAGTALITVSSNGVNSAPIGVTVSPATVTLTSIQISASASSLTVGSTLQFTATGTYSDKSTKDLTGTAAWISSNASFATVSSGTVTGVATGTALITAVSSGVSSQPVSVTVSPATVTLTSIQILASANSLTVGNTLQFTATGTYSDKSTKDLTGTATWQSSNGSFATVSGGTVTGVAAGTALITARSSGVTSAPVSVTVNPAAVTLTSIQISASASSVTVGNTLQLTAIGVYSDKSTKNLTGTATWQSSNGSFATVGGGTVTGVAAGTALITAASNGMNSAPLSVTVSPAAATLTSIQISASASSMAVGATLQFTATGTYSDNSTKNLTGTATWQSSNGSFATVSGGTVTGVAAGTAQIAATYNGVTSAPVSVTVNPAAVTLTSIQISASASSVTVGATLQFTATGTYSDKSTKNLTGTAIWQSSNGSFATVSGGTVTAVAAGTVQITASSSGVTSAPVSMTVNAAAVTLTSIQISASASSVTVGATLQFTATGTYSDKSTKNLTGTATWQSSNGSFATVSGGTVTAVAAGTAQITASSSGVTSAPVSVTVNAAAVTLTSIQISASASSVTVGATLQFTATGTYSDKSTKNLTGTATWQSSNGSFATVSAGTVTGVATGTAQITASSSGVTSTPVSVTVNAAAVTLTSIQISASASSVTVGATLQFTATGTYSDKSTKNLTGTATWQSSNGSFATVSAGTVIGVAAGTAQITASSSGVTSAPVSVTVGSTTATLNGLQISPAQPTVQIGSTTQLTANATYSDGSTSSVTGTATWTSGDPRTVAIAASGVVTGLATGSVTITATYQGQTATATVASSIGDVQWSGPITITQGGTYSGNWKSTSANTPAVTIATTAAVIIQNSRVTGPTDLISAPSAGHNLTVKNVIGIATNANVSGQPDGDFVNSQKPSSLDVENCYMENVDYGIWVRGYAGNGNSSQTITLLYNRARNMTGLQSNGNGGYLNGDSSSSWSHFIQLSNVNSLPGIQIAWNEIVNYPNQSLATAEIINMYEAGGTSASPALIHDNYIQGAYPYVPATDSFSGGGIITDGTTTDTVATASAYNDIYNNQVISTTNQGIELGAGHDNAVYNNEVISSGLLPDGTKIQGQNVGISIYDGYGNIARGTMYNNDMYSNTVGWANWKDSPKYRNDFYFPTNSSDTSTNTSISTNPITLAMENAEYSTWLTKVSQITVGPSIGASASPAAVQKLTVSATRQLNLTRTSLSSIATGSNGTQALTGASGAAASSLESVAIVPAQPSVAIGGTTQLKAVATFSDGSTKDVTAGFGWTSSDIRTVGVTSSGIVSGLAGGRASVSGSYLGQQAAATVVSSVGEIEWSGPIVIKQGGVYSGNWQSTDAKTPAVTVATTEPVTIQNSHIRSAANLIAAHVEGGDLTVRNTVGIALNPNVKGQPNGIFVDSSSPVHLDVENSYVENAQSGVRVRGYAGNRDGKQTIVIRANRARNMNGLLSDGKGGYLAGQASGSNFLRLEGVQAVPGVDLSWNEVINYPRRSLVSDVIDLYRASGTPNAPIEVHDTYIQGAFPYNPSLDTYNGGGIKVDGNADDTRQNASAYNSIHDNQVIGTVHYGIHFAAGHDNTASNNRVISSGLLPDGAPIAAQNVGMADSDLYGAGTRNGSMYNNTMQGNVIGWTCWSSACAQAGYRNDEYFPASDGDYSANSVLPAKTITPAMENNEYRLWLNKMVSSGMMIGPAF